MNVTLVVASDRKIFRCSIASRMFFSEMF